MRPVRISDVDCITETPKAILVVIDGDEHWVPQSQVHGDSEVYQRRDYGDLVVTSWFAEQRGWD